MAPHPEEFVAETESADRRTELAADRTIMAAERTYASWVQLGLGSLASGIGAKKLLQGMVPTWMTVGTGTLLVLFSAFCFGQPSGAKSSPGRPRPARTSGGSRPRSSSRSTASWPSSPWRPS